MKKITWLLIGAIYFVIRVIWYYLYTAFYAVWEAAYDDAKMLYYDKTAIRRWSHNQQPRSNYNNSGPVFKGPSGDPPVKRRKHRGRRGGRNRHHHH